MDAARAEFAQVDAAFSALLEHEKAQATGGVPPQQPALPPAARAPLSGPEPQSSQAPSAQGGAAGLATTPPVATAAAAAAATAAAAAAASQGAGPAAQVRELLSRLGVEVANHHSQLLGVLEMQRIKYIPQAHGKANTYLFDELFRGEQCGQGSCDVWCGVCTPWC